MRFRLVDQHNDEISDLLDDDWSAVVVVTLTAATASEGASSIYVVVEPGFSPVTKTKRSLIEYFEDETFVHTYSVRERRGKAEVEVTRSVEVEDDVGRTSDLRDTVIAGCRR